MTQPAISQHVRSLESQFDLDLFERHGRHVSITDAGRVLVPLARDLLQRGHRLEETMESLHGEVVGLLRIGCSTAAGKYVLPRVLAGLREVHPLVDVVCHVTTRRSALDLLRAGDVQVALTSLREPLNGIEYRPFLTDRIVLIAPPQHRWSKAAAPISVRKLTEELFISREEESGTVEAVREGLAHHDVSIEDLQVHMVVGNSEAVRMTVAEGIGVAFVSAMVAAEAVELGKVAVIDVENLDLTRTLYIARDAGRPAGRTQAAFWDYAFSPANDEIRRRPADLTLP
jgi:DNA-binding transcriptional LysR family regulator